MSLLDDTALFIAIIQQGGFSHAAKSLGLSNGLVSRRIKQLETNLGVTLIKRTTRQIQLTPEGELFWQHAQRIQQELDLALTLIHASAKKPKGMIRISAPLYFGRKYLTPIITKFLSSFPDIQIHLILNNQKLDPIKEQIDLIIRGTGYMHDAPLKDSNLQMKNLLTEKIGLYASAEYLQKNGEPTSPQQLSKHDIINTTDTLSIPHEINWDYSEKNTGHQIRLKPGFSSNDIESSLTACVDGHGIAKFTELNVRSALQQKTLRPILTDYHWGNYQLFVMYPQQKILPKRTRLLLDYIQIQARNIMFDK